MSLGNLQLVNTMILQLFIPLSFLGIIYRPMKHALTNMGLIFKLLDKDSQIQNEQQAKTLQVTDTGVALRNIKFPYNKALCLTFNLNQNVTIHRMSAFLIKIN